MIKPSGGRLAALLAATIIATCTAATPPPAVQPDISADSALPGKVRAFVLTIAKSDSRRPFTRVALLACSPPRGTHPKAAEACAKLAKVRGDLSVLEPDGTVCTLIFDPVTVTATGSWDGGTFSFERTYGNACELRAMTGPIFDF
ncbi:protease [Acrocarpospora corrugata]|uniref:Protease n=1 Tax=Acrocarpospora corrugata TaxID=35763 RepID=A0A5M3WD30_9ACTN|nr:SSI family serine proteinase inhibitor [Acrocarpospora corrugata]GES04338.1 protease [Acrocarpospora corrugata]